MKGIKSVFLINGMEHRGRHKTLGLTGRVALGEWGNHTYWVHLTVRCSIWELFGAMTIGFELFFGGGTTVFCVAQYF